MHFFVKLTQNLLIFAKNMARLAQIKIILSKVIKHLSPIFDNISTRYQLLDIICNLWPAAWPTGLLGPSCMTSRLDRWGRYQTLPALAILDATPFSPRSGAPWTRWRDSSVVRRTILPARGDSPLNWHELWPRFAHRYVSCDIRVDPSPTDLQKKVG